MAFDASPNLAFGTYTGNGGGQSVSGVGFNPDYLLLMEDGASRAMHHSYHWNQSFSFNDEASFASAVTGFTSNGFTLGSNSHVNETARTYHYVAWLEVPGQMRTSWYFGDDVDNRSLVAGLQPEYVIVKAIDTNEEAVQGFASMTGDSSLTFKKAASPNWIQALQTSGFQLGDDNEINNDGTSYFFVAFGNDPAPGLGATEAPGTLTITAPNYFDLTFSTLAGAGVEQFHDLTSGPNDDLDLAGGASIVRSLFFDSMALSGIWYNTGQNDVEPEIDLLEATATRVKVRQEAFYQREGGTTLVAGVKGLGDYSIYPSGRMALRWERRSTKTVANQISQMGLSVHKRNPQHLSTWSAWSETAALPSPGGRGGPVRDGGDGRRLVWHLHRFSPDPLPSMDRSRLHGVAPESGNRGGVGRRRLGRGAGPDAAGPRAVGLHDPFQAHRLRGPHRRQRDRAKGRLSLPGRSRRNHGLRLERELADADFFNESEGAYTLDMDAANGLAFDMNGSVIKRPQPFFKIRQWRSLQKPTAVSLEGAALTPNQDYRADVKPVSRAPFASQASLA